MKRLEQIDNLSFTLISTGGIIFAIVCILTVQDLRDQTVQQLFLPGMMMAFPWLVAGLVLYIHKSRSKRRAGRVFKSHRL